MSLFFLFVMKSIQASRIFLLLAFHARLFRFQCRHRLEDEDDYTDCCSSYMWGTIYLTSCLCICSFHQTHNQVTNVDTTKDTAQGEKLLGDPAAVQSPTAMGQATGVRLSPAIDREEQTTNREKIKRKAKLLTNSRCAESSGRSYAYPSNYPTIYTLSPSLNHRTPGGVPIVTSQLRFNSLLVGNHII